jgi:TetR/AcrR family transcriptional regulator, cholesterol catabolism regulator
LAAAGPDRTARTRKRAARGRRTPSAERHQEVLEAAAKVFYERGYINARVQDVAAEVGLLKGSLYHYIDGKEDVLFRLLDETHDEVHRILDEVEALPDSVAPLDRLHEYVRRQIAFNMENLVRVSVYYRDLQCLSPPLLRKIVDRRREHERFVEGLIEAAQERGEVDPAREAEVLSKFVFAAIIWTYRWYSPARDDGREVDRRCADFTVDGLVGSYTLPNRLVD